MGAQKVAESLDIEAEERAPAATITPIERRPLKSINVLYRGMIKNRRQREAQERLKRDVQDSLTYRRPDFNMSDDDDDDDENGGFGKLGPVEFFEQDLEDEDEELDQFNGREPNQRLAQLTEYLRRVHLYCFWCKSKYPDTDFLGCPGFTEEDHEA
jgi:hypothetical protein